MFPFSNYKHFEIQNYRRGFLWGGVFGLVILFFVFLFLINTIFISDFSPIVTLLIIIIIMSWRQHGYPWPSLATSPSHSSLLAGLRGYMPYPHTTAVCMFELVVLLLLGQTWGSIGVHHWVRPCFSSSVLRVWFV